MKSPVSRRDSSQTKSRRSHLEEESDDCMQSLLAAGGSSAKYSSAVASNSSRQQQIRLPAQHHQQRSWNSKVQFDETFVWQSASTCFSPRRLFLYSLAKNFGSFVFHNIASSSSLSCCWLVSVYILVAVLVADVLNKSTSTCDVCDWLVTWYFF